MPRVLLNWLDRVDCVGQVGQLLWLLLLWLLLLWLLLLRHLLFILMVQVQRSPKQFSMVILHVPDTSYLSAYTIKICRVVCLPSLEAR
jgi:hypothetical protein